MNLNKIVIIIGVIVVIGITGGVAYKISQRTEGYKAKGDLFTMKCEPRFGCASLKVVFYNGDNDKPTFVMGEKDEKPNSNISSNNN